MLQAGKVQKEALKDLSSLLYSQVSPLHMDTKAHCIWLVTIRCNITASLLNISSLKHSIIVYHQNFTSDIFGSRLHVYRQLFIMMAHIKESTKSSVIQPVTSYHELNIRSTDVEVGSKGSSAKMIVSEYVEKGDRRFITVHHINISHLSLEAGIIGFGLGVLFVWIVIIFTLHFSNSGKVKPA
ncbi:uncharacterized protein LOC111270467 [Varroa jacobsoni]|uniref:uncharacterized protein LOC111270467 n=1 Tax=Varroa jacobsoni TaxID=62625 RepID=UPI000BF7038A|nr:uncharacterized protein LOC111270467 [Varroa jacobsoni]